MCTIHLSKVLMSPSLTPPLHILQYVLLVEACHYVDPAPLRWRHVSGSGRYGSGHTHMFPNIPCPVFQQVVIQLLSCCVFLLTHHPIHWNHNLHEVKSLRKASLKIFSLFVPLVLRQDFVWVSTIIGVWICVNNANIEDTPPMSFPEAKHYRIPVDVRKIKAPLQGVPELLPGYTSAILGSGKDSDPPTVIAGPFQLPFGLLDQSRLHDTQLPLLPIHYPVTPCLTPLLHLSGMWPEIQCLSVEQWGSHSSALTSQS